MPSNFKKKKKKKKKKRIIPRLRLLIHVDTYHDYGWGLMLGLITVYVYQNTISTKSRHRAHKSQTR